MIDAGTDLVSLDGSIDGSNDFKLEVLLIKDSLGSTDKTVLGSYEGIKLGLFDGKVRDTIFGNVYVITLGIIVGTDLVSLDGSLYSSNDVNIE